MIVRERVHWCSLKAPPLPPVPPLLCNPSTCPDMWAQCQLPPPPPHQPAQLVWQSTYEEYANSG